MEREMASIIFSAKDIFEQEFGREVRGYSKAEVDEFLDDVIKDYETYAALVKSLRQEIADLKEELSNKPQASSTQQSSIDVTSSTPMTNFDILKRLNRLEKEVFGKQIVDNSEL
ncbi:cell division regulator GpsB [Streptococcus oralis]|uniref:Cell cycle protein GpsB n=2 Tax=Streptococcus oralis TaxID=1303 RepID=A0A7T2ZXV9_STROR|nr:cell division regulator GpsB [Streptococcus oralis]QPT02535.1 cell division regulator GpsB [Streptococcus oralis]